jgi:phage repressor protein C with HTH and peptisase S24 domain
MSTPMQQTKVENEQKESLLKSSDAFRARLRTVVNFFNSNIEAADQIGATETTIRRWLSGAAEPRKPALAKLASAAGISYEWLVHGVGAMNIDGSKVEKVENTKVEKVSLKTKTVISDNMEPVLYIGDEIELEPVSAHLSEVPGGIYAVRVGSSEGIWRLQHSPNRKVWLLNDNPRYQQSNATVDVSEADDLEIVGRVVSVRHKF